MTDTDLTTLSKTFHVEVNADLIDHSTTVAALHGAMFENPCTVCRCNMTKHRVRYGEVICTIHLMSCSKALGSRMKREAQDAAGAFAKR